MSPAVANLIVSAISTVGGGVGGVLTQLTNLLKNAFTAATKFHEEGITFARGMGMTAREAQAYTKVLTERTEKLASVYGVTAEKVKELQRNISVATSKQLMLNDAQAEHFLQINKLVGSDVTNKFTEEMMNGMGAQADAVTGAVSKAYATAAKSGLNAQKVTEKIANNLNMANKLSFRTGINGLTRMAMQAEKIGMSLSTVESVANNFMEIDSAIEHSAMLNMLGGAAGIFGGNPLDMAYEANNDPEALQRRIDSMLGGLASFDSVKGIASMNGLNMDFARNIAKALGMNPDEAVRVAKRKAEVGYKEKNINFGAYGNLSEEQKNYLINTSQVKNGKVLHTYIDDNGKAQQIDLSKGEGSKDLIEKLTKFAGMSDEEIMRQQAMTLTSINEKLAGFAESIQALFAKFLNGLFPRMVKDIDGFGNFVKQKLYPVAENVGKAVRQIIDFVRQYKDPIKSIATFAFKALEFMTKYWQLSLGVWGILKAFKLFKLFGGNSLSFGGTGGAARSAARSAARGLGSLFTKGKNLVTSRGFWDVLLGRQHKNAAGRWVNSKGRFISNNLAKVGKFAKVGGAVVGAGIGIYNAVNAQEDYADKLMELHRQRKSGAISQAEFDRQHNAARNQKNENVGEGVGTAIGSIAGMFFGPIGSMIGGILGSYIGKYLGRYWTTITGYAKKAWDTLASYLRAPFKAFENFGFKVGDLIIKGLSHLPLIGKYFRTEKHANGGIVGGNGGTDSTPAMLTPGEIVLSDTMQKNLVSILQAPSVKSKAVVGEKPEYVYKPNGSQTSNVNGNTITVKDFNINLTGTLRLDGGNSSKNIDVNELLKDQAFITALKNVIKTSINQDINGGRYMNDLATMGGFPSQTSIYAKHTSL